MTIKELCPVQYAQNVFAKSRCHLIPRTAGCYALCRADGFILYIGQTKNLRERCSRHLHNQQKTMPTKQGAATLFCYVACPVCKLDYIENSWLQKHRHETGTMPILNKVSAPVR